MNTPKHTPGPWIVEDYFVFASNTLRIADCDCDEQDMPESEIEANTRLIAAAPAMYEALQIMVRAANVDEIDPLVMFASIERAKGALAQAEGRDK